MMFYLVNFIILNIHTCISLTPLSDILHGSQKPYPLRHWRQSLEKSNNFICQNTILHVVWYICYCIFGFFAYYILSLRLMWINDIQIGVDFSRSIPFLKSNIPQLHYLLGWWMRGILTYTYSFMFSCYS